MPRMEVQEARMFNVDLINGLRVSFVAVNDPSRPEPPIRMFEICDNEDAVQYRGRFATFEDAQAHASELVDGYHRELIARRREIGLTESDPL